MGFTYNQKGVWFVCKRKLQRNRCLLSAVFNREEIMKENKATIKIDFHEIVSFYNSNSNTDSLAALTRKLCSDIETSLEQYKSEYLSIKVKGTPHKGSTSKDSTGILMFSALSIVLGCGVGSIIDKEITNKIISQIWKKIKSTFIDNPEVLSEIYIEIELDKRAGKIKVTGTKETLALNTKEAERIQTTMIQSILESQETRNDIATKFEFKMSEV